MLSLQPDPDGLTRDTDFETSVAIQHELFRGLSVSGSWFRRSTHNERRTDNLLVTNANYIPVDMVSPLDGQVFTAYNLDPSKRAQYNAIDYNSTDSDKRSRVYNGYELGVSGRLHGASFFGGWGFEQLVSVQCDAVDNPNNYLGGLLNPTAQSAGSPISAGAIRASWTSRFDMGQAVRLVHDSVGHPGQRRVAELRRAHPRHVLGHRGDDDLRGELLGPCKPGQPVVPNLLTAPNTAAALRLALQAPGTDYYGRQNQLDLGFRKLFHVGRYTYSGQVDIFNSTNNGYVKTETRLVGTSLGQPLSNLQPRTLRLAVQMRF